MKTLILSILVFSLAGCATLGAAPGAGESTTAAGVASTTDAGVASTTDASATPIGSPSQDMSPKIIIPVTGGAPVLGIPLGGNIFLPVTGGAPEIGMPIGP